jgi:predicted nucleic acid-binding protein
MILECALAAEADFIVSGDKKHLLVLRQFEAIWLATIRIFQ